MRNPKQKKRMDKRRGFLYAIAGFLIYQSCGSSPLFRKDVDTPNGWEIDREISFTLKDSIPFKSNIYLHLRNDNAYPFANIFVIATLEQNDSILVRDTLEYAMANPDGSWKGTGFLSVKESKLWWREMPAVSSGSLTVGLSQANRANGIPEAAPALPGIVSVGVSIEKAEE